ncbi:MAG TPA: hypothetical protein VF268_09110 [Gammaproteobacteria bacterium]
MRIPSFRICLAVPVFAIVAASAARGADSGQTPGLPPNPDDWVCYDPGPPSEDRIKELCEDEYGSGEYKSEWGKPVDLGVPGTISDLAQKNAYDERLQDFLVDKGYRDWVHDLTWRLTGPYVGEIPGGKSYGVHPAVRIYYSPEIMEWLCGGRKGEIKDNAMLVKEMHNIDASLGIHGDRACMVITKSPEPTSWTVMVRTGSKTFDGWYWANPARPRDPAKSEHDGNPPILDRSAVTREDFFGKPPVERNPAWYPTGDLFSNQKPANVVSPYSLYGAYCLNCHASAEKYSTFASLDNILTPGILYKRFPQPPTADSGNADSSVKALSGAAHADASAPTAESPADYGFSRPLDKIAPGFKQVYGDLGVETFTQVIDLRLPAETYDHHFAGPDGPGQFLTSDQCIGCHDATVSNDSVPNMLITDRETGKQINVSPYGEWRASPMGLAGRDPIFFSQLQSETNNLPQLEACIENTCLHCHGVMGQRQYSADTQKNPDNECKALFAVAPPEQVPFGQPFRLDMVTRWQDTKAHGSVYGNLARDGISCTVCHHVSDTGLGEEKTFTGNFVTGPANEVYGPFGDDTIVTKPMEHALGITPKFGKQITNSDMCGSCHNILLPVFNNDGTRHKVATVNGRDLFASYEQTTHLEWVNSVFAQPGDEFASCQDCHMPTMYKDQDLSGTRIANIESDDFPPTTHRLPNDQIELAPREKYTRHSLHGLNIFLNEMFQQFPLILGVRQIDYMGSISTGTQPSLVTANQSMVEMAGQQTADIEIQELEITSDGQLLADVLVTNKTGHFLPSGVGFRRVFIEFTVEDKSGALIWASGRTNELGMILDGTGDKVLSSEQGVDNTDAYQPHYETITNGSQVQIYQELIKDSAGRFTTSFLRRVRPVKDNRLRGKGYDPEIFAKNPSPYIQMLAELEGKAASDPYYFDSKLTGADRIRYLIRLSPAQAGNIGRVKVRLLSQSIPPFYLQERFDDAGKGPAEKGEIQRLYYLTGHLNTRSGSSPIKNWKLPLVEDCRLANGKPCES